LMDDRDGVRAACSEGIAVVGTLGILCRADQCRLRDLAYALDRIKRTNFRYRQESMPS
jgi:predicted nucleic acid-binding protein